MDLEHIYDERIAPLMTQIIQIAKEHNMPFVFAFQLTDDEEDEEGPLLCTSCLLPDGCDEKMIQAKKLLSAPASTTTLSITTRGADGAVQAIEHILFTG